MESQKQAFNLREGIHYLNCAYKAPLLKSAEEAAIKALIKERNPIDISQDDFFEEAVEVRELFGKLVHCKAENVALIPSTSYGFASVLGNVKAKPNGKAITVKREFPSAYFSLKRWCTENNNRLQIIDPTAGVSKIGEEWTTKIFEAIDDSTAVVVLSGIHWIYGTKFDLKRIGEKCKQHNAKFLVDGTQMIGAVPVDLQTLHIDALICASYKWLFGPYSLAVSYISDAFSGGRPLEESFMNRSNARDFSKLADYDENYQDHAARYNVGESSNFLLMPVLKQGLKQVLEWQPENIQAYCKNLSLPLVDYLHSVGISIEDDAFASRHLISVLLPDSIDKNLMKENLAKSKVYVSHRADYMRIAINVYNTPEDIKAIIDVLKMSLVSEKVLS